MATATGDTNADEQTQRRSVAATAGRGQGRQRRDRAVAGAARVAGGRRMERAPAGTSEDFTREWDEHFATAAGFHALTERHRAGIYRVALHLLQQEQEAEEVAFDAFARTYLSYRKRRATGRPFRSPPIPYLYRTAKNRALDIRRAWQRRPPPVPLAASTGERGLLGDQQTDAADAEERELLAATRDCIRRLPSPHREVCAHYYLEGLSLAEVATALRLPYTRVRGLLKSSREQIGRLLAPHLLAMALDGLAAADQAVLRPHYFGDKGWSVADEALPGDLVRARWRLVGSLLRWDILFLRLPPEERCALAAFAQTRDHTLTAAAVRAFRGRGAGLDARRCTAQEAAGQVARALVWLDRRLRDALKKRAGASAERDGGLA